MLLHLILYHSCECRWNDLLLHLILYHWCECRWNYSGGTSCVTGPVGTRVQMYEPNSAAQVYTGYQVRFACRGLSVPR
jgi:hypothetical protein